MRRGNSLVGLLVVVAIIALCSVLFLKGGSILGMGKAQSARKDGLGTTIPGAAIAKAKDDKCMEYLRQIRMKVNMDKDMDTDEGKFPSSLEETHLGSDFYRCPIGGEHYLYNPDTGVVSCPHPGHEKY